MLTTVQLDIIPIVLTLLLLQLCPFGIEIEWDRNNSLPETALNMHPSTCYQNEITNNA